MRLAPRLLMLCLGAAMACPAFTAEVPANIPALTEMPANPQRLAPVLLRFQADLGSVEHTHDITAGPQREAALRALYQGWQVRLTEFDDASLGLEDQIDHALLARELDYQLRQLAFERRRYEQASPLLPKLDSLIALAEARRALRYVDARTSAETLEAARKSLAQLQSRIERDKKSAPVTDPVVAFRAARLLDGVRSDLKDWYTFYNGYDPAFSWWNRQPYEALDKQMTSYAKVLRDELAGASNPETIIGDPIGREALEAELQHEMIPYTPEQIVMLAERELALSQAEMAKTAKQMGFDDWHQALEKIKGDGPALGDQPKLVVQLADEAIDYVTKNDLVTVPELAKRDWRMTMLTPEYQLQAPFSSAVKTSGSPIRPTACRRTSAKWPCAATTAISPAPWSTTN